ncbi:hypothetical protein L7F22_054918 [Adiantum nelumboides]|nr:hypothetical protein [Adiantum nelumboides]
MALYLRGRTPQIEGLHMPIDGSPDLVEQEYVDDTMIFCQYDSDTLDRLHSTLSVFCCASGSLINWHKSSGFVVGGDDVCTWGEHQGFTWVAPGQTCRYLGFHVGLDVSPRQQFEPVLASIRRKLCHWASMHLSLAGRALVVNQVLLAIAWFTTSCWTLYPWALSRLRCLVRNFLWGGSDESEQGIFDQVLHGTLDFTTDPWPQISDCAKDLISNMLNRDPKKRFTAHEVLCHPWICKDGMAPDRSLDPAVLSRMKQFMAVNKLKKIALRFIGERLKEEEIAGLKEIFKMMDTDGSGAITFEELKAGLRRLGSPLVDNEVRVIMEAADIDKNGSIDYEEFIAATMLLNKRHKEEDLAAAFSYFDKDGSGLITKNELKQTCLDHRMDASEVQDILREIDQNNDGCIDYGEFVSMMCKGTSGLSRRALRYSSRKE